MNGVVNFNVGRYLCNRNHHKAIKEVIRVVAITNEKIDLRITWWNDGYEDYSNTAAELAIRHIDRAVRDANDMPDDVKQMMIDDWR
jgi:hypothetical protein